jgi:hypothetical protein
MNEFAYLYRFADNVDMAEVTDTLLLAVAAAQALHGRAKVHLDAEFELNEADRCGRVSASNEVGKDIARIFVEYLTLEIGEKDFTVEPHSPPARKEVRR